MKSKKPISSRSKAFRGLAERLSPKEPDRIPLIRFVREAWRIVDTSAYIDNWHVEAICDHLEAVTFGEISELIINVPPGFGKSLIVSVLWPAWEWTFRPEIRWLFTSHNRDLATRDSTRCRRLLRSTWYRKRWESVFRLAKDQNQKDRFENSCGGWRIASSLGSDSTGERTDRVIGDDPHDIRHRHSLRQIDSAMDVWNSVISTRVDPGPRAGKVVVMQRIHENDATAQLLEQGYEHLCLPAEFEPGRRCKTSIGWEDPRQHHGELLFPQLYNQEVLARIKERGEAIYSALYQQHPTSADGDEIKRVWWRYWHHPGSKLPSVPVRTANGVQTVDSVELPAGFKYQAQSWDTAFKDTETSSFVVGQVWGKYQARYFLLDQVRARVSFTETLTAIKRMYRKWPDTRAKYIEDSANGPAIIDMLKREIPGLISIRAKDSKVARARSVSSLIEAGNIFLPHPRIAPGITPGFINEWAGIPAPAYWDQIDAASQFLNRALVRKPHPLTWGRH